MNLDVTVDRIEENFAVCEDDNEKVYFIENSKLPGEVTEGYVLTIRDDGTVILNQVKTQERRDTIKRLQKSIFNK